jgi:hypothetical protein
VLAVEFLPTVGCVAKRVELWYWFYLKVSHHAADVCSSQKSDRRFTLYERYGVRLNV